MQIELLRIVLFRAGICGAMEVPKTVVVLLLVASALAGKTHLPVISTGHMLWKKACVANALSSH